MKMPHLITVLAALTALGLTTGCEKPRDMDQPSPNVPVAPATNALYNPSGSVPPPPPPVSQAVTRTAGEFANVPKIEFQARLRQGLTDLNREIDRLAEDAVLARDDVKADAGARVAELKEKAARLNERLEGVPAASEATWEALKAGIGKAYAELKESVNQSREWLTSKGKS